MRRGEDAYFCSPCNANISYEGPVVPENFQFTTHRGTLNAQGELTELEVIAYFADYTDKSYEDTQITEGMGDIHPLKGAAGRHAEALETNGEQVDSIARTLCRKIGDCTGMILTETGLVCPAFNNIELRRLM